MTLISEFKEKFPIYQNIRDDKLAGLLHDKTPRYSGIEKQKFVRTAVGIDVAKDVPPPSRFEAAVIEPLKKGFQGKVEESREAKGLEKLVPFLPSTLITEQILPRKTEAIQAIGVRKALGLDIPERLTRQLESGEFEPLDIISTQREIPKAIQERFPDVTLEDIIATKMRQPGAVLAAQMFKEPLKEIADLAGFIIRPDQIFGLIPALSLTFKTLGFVGKKAIRGIGAVRRLIKRSGIKKGDTIEVVAEKIAERADRETKIPKEQVAKEPPPTKTSGGKTVGRIATETPDDINKSMNPPEFSPEQRRGIKIPAIPQEGALPKQIISKSDIIKFMSEKLDVPIRIGRMRKGKSTLGFFKVKPEVIRTRLADDVPVAAHELGHFLEKNLFKTTKLQGQGLTGKAFDAFGDELAKIATSANEVSSVNSEGFAEFVSRFIVDREAAKKIAPKFYKWFIDDVLENRFPDMKEILFQLSDDFARWMKQSSVAKVMGQISFGEGRGFRLPSFSKIYTAAKEKFYPIHLAVKNINPDIAINENPFILARLYADHIGQAEQFLKFGQISTKAFAIGQKTGASLEEILAPIRTRHKEFSAYLVARRSLELTKRGKATGISLVDAKQAFKELDNPVFGKAFKELDKFQDNFVRLMIESDFFTGRSAAIFKEMNKQYTPFFRIIETETTGVGGGISSVFNPVKRLSREGSTRQIIDPLESIIKNVYTYTALAKKQRVLKALAKLTEFDKSGKYIERVPKEVAPIKISNEELYKIFREFSVWTERTEFKEFKNSFSKTTGIKDGKISKPIEKLESIIIDSLKARGMTEGEGKAFIARLKAAKGAEEVDKIVETVIEKQTILHTVRQMDLDLPNWVEIFRPKEGLPKGNFIHVFNKGKKLLFELDPELHKAIAGLDVDSTNLLVRIMSIPARTLRAGATLTPEFSFKNIMRDPFSAFVFSKSGFVPGVDTAKGFFHALGQDKWYQAFRVSGGGHSMLVSLDRNLLQQNLQGILNDVTAGGKLKNVVRHPIETLRIMSELFETSNRLGNFTKTYKQFTKLSEKANRLAETAPNTLDKKRPFIKFKVLGKARQVENTQRSLRQMSEQFLRERLPASAFEAREITLDFSRIGSKMRAMNQITAFFNARLEGYDKAVRVFKERPFAATAKAITAITLPSMYLWWANKDDPRYQELPRWEKMMFWHILTDERIWRIPKPFELGFLFGTIPENILDWLDKKDPEGIKRLFEGLQKDFINTILPNAPRPLIENWANKSFFFDRPIVGREQEGILPKYQSRPWTSETAKLVGKILNYSPAKIENIILGYTGGLGRLALEAADRAVLQFIDEPVQPAPSFSDIPVLRSFVSRFPTAGAESVERFYDKYGKMQQTFKTYEVMLKSNMSIKTIQEFEKDNKELLGLYLSNREFFDGTRGAIGMGYKLITLTFNNRNMTPEQKRKEIDKTYLSMIKTAKDAVTLIKQQEKK